MLLRVDIVLITGFDVPDLHLCILYNLVECSEFEVVSGLHLTHRSLKGFSIARFDLADESNDAVMRLKLLALAFVSAPFADDFGFNTLFHNMRQVGVHSLVQLAVAAVIYTRSLLNQTSASVIQSLIEGVLLLAVFIVTYDLNSFHFIFLHIANLFRFKNLTTVTYRTHISFGQVGFSTNTTKTDGTV